MSAFDGGLRRVVRIQTRRVTHRREDSGLGGGKLRGGFSEVELRRAFGAERIATEVRRVEIPLEDLRAPELRRDLRGEDAFTQRASEGGRLVEEEEVGDESLREGIV